jgi:hypothetical protein
VFVWLRIALRSWLLASAVVSFAAEPDLAGTRAYRETPSRDVAPPYSLDKLSAQFGALPLSFEVNQGQFDPDVRFRARADGYTVFVTPGAAMFVSRSPLPAPAHQRDGERAPGRRVGRQSTKPSVVTMRLEGAKRGARISGLDELPERVNYFLTKDPSGWRTDVPTYGRVRVGEVYDGIDLVYYGNGRRLEYDFVVQPGADPTAIRIAFDGVESVDANSSSDVMLRTAAGDFTLKKPFVYQVEAGERREIASAYRVDEKGRVSFEIASWDRGKPLVIDPVLQWMTMLGGSSYDWAVGIGVDSSKNVYVIGGTDSSDFVTTGGAYQTSGGGSVFVTKLNPLATSRIWSTYIGYRADPSAGVVDAAGNVYVTGSTYYPAQYPTTQGALATTGNMFVTKLSSSGNNLVASTFLTSAGGTTTALALSGGAVVIAGYQGVVENNLLPTTPGAAVPANQLIGDYDHGFVLKLSSTFASLSMCTYLTKSEDTYPFAVAAFGADTYVGGWTWAPDLQTTAGAYQPAPAGDVDAFICRVGSGGAFQAATYLGGSEAEWVSGLAADASGNVYAVGNTSSTGYFDEVPFPTTPHSFQRPNVGAFEVYFATKLTPNLQSLLYSTAIGPAYADSTAIAIDERGFAYIVGCAGDENFPATPGFIKGPPQRVGWGDGALAVVNATGTGLIYSTRLGGVDSTSGYYQAERATAVAVDDVHDVYVAGVTAAPDFPTTDGAVDRTFQSQEAWIAKIRPLESPGIGSVAPDTGPSIGGTSLTITGTGFQAGASVIIAGSPAEVTNVTPTSISATTGPHASGLFDVVVTNTNGGTTKFRDGFTYTCNGSIPTGSVSGFGSICAGQSANVTATLTGAPPWRLVWSDGVTESNVSMSPHQRSVSPQATTTYRLTVVSDASCAGNGTGSATISVNASASSVVSAPAALCAGTSAQASVPAGVAGTTYAWNVTNGTITAGNGTNSITYTVGATGSLHLDVAVNGGGCSSSNGRDIPIQAPPTATLSGGGTACAGTTVPLQVALSGTAPWSVSFSDGFTASDIVSTPYTRPVAPNANETYTITAVQDAGCGGTFSGSAPVTVVPAPSAAITAPSIVCRGSSGIVASVPDAGAGATYVWNLNAATITGGQGTRSITFSVGQNGPVGLDVSVTAGSCTTLSSKSLTVSPPPSAVVTDQGSTICAGSGVTLHATLAGGAPYSLVWSDGFQQVVASGTQASRVVNPASTTTYSVTSITSPSGCPGSVSGNVTITVSPTASAAITASSAVCPSSSGNGASVPDAGAGATYQWIVSGGTVTSGAGTSSITFAAGGGPTLTLNVSVNVPPGCNAASSKQLGVAQPSATAIGSNLLYAAPSANIQFSLTGAPPWTVGWSDGITQSNILASPATRTVTPLKTRTYTLTSVSNGTCSGAATGSVQVIPTGVGDVNGDGLKTVLDVFYLISNLFAGGPAPLRSADVNADNSVTVLDVFYLINYLFAGGPPPPN